MPKSNYLIMYCLLFVLFTYAFGADTIYVSMPLAQFQDVIISPYYPDLEQENVEIYYTNLDIYPNEYNNLYGKTVIKQEWASKHFSEFSKSNVFLADKNNKILSKGYFNHYEYFLQASSSVFSICYNVDTKDDTSAVYLFSENTFEYFNPNLEIIHNIKFKSNIVDSIENNSIIHHKYSFAVKTDSATTEYCLLSYEIVDTTRNSYSMLKKPICRNRMFIKKNDTFKEVFSYDEYFLVYKSFATQLIMNDNPLLTLIIAEPYSDIFFDCNLVWNNGKYELQGSRIIFE